MKKNVFIFISMLSGSIILLGLLFPESIFNPFKQELLNWTIIISSISMIIAIFGLFTLHWKKIFSGKNSDYSSVFFIIGFLIVFLTGLFGQLTNKFFLNMSKTVLISVESSLLAVLAITLAFASYRLFREKHDFFAIVFGVSTILFLLLFSGILSSGENSPFLKAIISAFNSLPTSGATGIMIGIAIGAIVTSLRALLGFIHPFDR